MLRVFKTKTLWKYNTKTCNFPVFLNKREYCFLYKRNLFIHGKKHVRVKKEITEFGNKLFIKVNLLELNREKYNLKYNYNIYKIKTLT